MKAQQTLTNQTIVSYEFENDLHPSAGAGISYLKMPSLPQALNFNKFSTANDLFALVVPQGTYTYDLNFNAAADPFYLGAEYSNLQLIVVARVNQGNGNNNVGNPGGLGVKYSPDGINFFDASPNAAICGSKADVSSLHAFALPNTLNGNPKAIIRLTFSQAQQGFLIDGVGIVGNITLPAANATLFNQPAGWTAAPSPLTNNGTNIGIGTLTPDSPLHVVGTTHIAGNGIIDGDLKVNGTGGLGVKYNAFIQGDLLTLGHGSFGDNVQMAKDLAVKGNESIDLNLKVGATTTTSRLSVSQQSDLYGKTFLYDEVLQQRTVTQPFTYNLITEVLGDDATNRDKTIAFLVKNDGAARLSIFGDGSIATDGKICAQRFNATLNGLNCWPDYVFEADYPLMSPARLEAYIKENKHLPDIPSAEEVAANGHDIGDMNVKLLQKVEELTLYILQLEKRLQKLETPAPRPNNER